MMRIAVYEPKHLKAFSLLFYTQQIKQQLAGQGVTFVSFDQDQSLPADVDLYWDPRAAGGGAPARALQNVDKPLVVTLHGAGPFALPLHEMQARNIDKILIWLSNQLMRWRWAKLVRLDAVITVSQYARQEIAENLPIPAGKIVPIHHGLNHDLFLPGPGIADVDSYLLHISQYRAKKNVERIFEAYQMLTTPDKPGLVVVVPGYPEAAPIPGIQVIREPMPQPELVGLYQRALSFVFPSLHESFGFPIVEAMACGCPVMTSDTTACAEVAGNAALLVDPRSVDAIAGAMQRLIEDAALRANLRARGIARAAHFTWEKSARQHLQVFENVLSGRQINDNDE